MELNKLYLTKLSIRDTRSIAYKAIQHFKSPHEAPPTKDTTLRQKPRGDSKPSIHCRGRATTIGDSSSSLPTGAQQWRLQLPHGAAAAARLRRERKTYPQPVARRPSVSASTLISGAAPKARCPRQPDSAVVVFFRWHVDHVKYMLYMSKIWSQKFLSKFTYPETKSRMSAVSPKTQFFSCPVLLMTRCILKSLGQQQQLAKQLAKQLASTPDRKLQCKFACCLQPCYCVAE